MAAGAISPSSSPLHPPLLLLLLLSSSPPLSSPLCPLPSVLPPPPHTLTPSLPPSLPPLLHGRSQNASDGSTISGQPPHCFFHRARRIPQICVHVVRQISLDVNRTTAERGGVEQYKQEQRQIPTKPSLWFYPHLLNRCPPRPPGLVIRASIWPVSLLCSGNDDNSNYNNRSNNSKWK